MYLEIHTMIYGQLCIQLQKRFSSHARLHKQVPVAGDWQCHTAHIHSLPVAALSSARRLGWALWTCTSPHCPETSPLTWRGEESYDLPHCSYAHLPQIFIGWVGVYCDVLFHSMGPAHKWEECAQVVGINIRQMYCDMHRSVSS